MDNTKKPELLAPAGNLEKLKFALLYGADAVYLGGKNYSLRAMGENFTAEEMAEGIKFAHSMGKKAYVTVNIFPHKDDFGEMPEFLSYLQEVEADGILVADLGIFDLAKQYCPKTPLHISTQANVTNVFAAKAWEKLGANRIVLARELSLGEIENISQNIGIETEIFVHGAMCISYSGRCLLSSYLTGRDSNRGSCAQACRWRYGLVEENRPGEVFPIGEDERGSYILNSKDLCLLPYLPQVMKSGARSLKIEGRMKSVHYVATVTAVYRRAIDAYFAAPKEFSPREEWISELGKVSHRPYTTGFFFDRPGSDGQVYGTSTYEQSMVFVGVVRDFDKDTGETIVEQRGRFVLGDEIEILTPEGNVFHEKLKTMHDENGANIAVAPHPQQIVKTKFKTAPPPFSILRKTLQAPGA